MRVAVVVERTVHYRDTEGVRRVQRVAEHLAARGHEVRVFCTQFWPGYDLTRDLEGVTYHAVTVSPARTSYLARVPALVAGFRPDVVYGAPVPPGVVRSARAGAGLARAPLVVDWFGDEDVASRFGPAVRAPDTVVVPSRLVQTAVRELGVPEDRTRVIPESVDMGLVRETEPDEAADVVYARRLDDDANLESLLLALAELRQRGWSAAVLGDGPAREEYEEQAADLRIDDRVAFLGERPREERVALYRGAHVFVHTARRTCFATELLWALACGCVGVVEYQEESSAHELVEGHPRGFRATSPEEVEDAIVEASDLAERDVDETFADYDHDAVLERYLQCFRDAGAGQ